MKGRNRYLVFSKQSGRFADGEIVGNTLEVSRSDRRVAEQDAAIIKDILRRTAWVEDSEAVEEVTRVAA